MARATRREETFVDAHGVTVHYYVWEHGAPRGIVQIVHGLGEYATRYEQVAQALVAAGHVVYAGDLRGHGATGMGQWAGDAARLGRLGPGGVRATVAGIRQLTALAREQHPGLPLALLGHSMGSIFAQKLMNADAAQYDAVVLSGTAYRTLLHMNSGDLNKRHRHLGTTGAEWLSRDPAVAEAFVTDPLRFRAQTIKLFGIPDAMRLLGRPAALDRNVPLLIQIGEDDPLGGPRSIELLARAYRRRGGLTSITVHVYPGARHEVYYETNRDEVIDDLVRWLGEHLA